MVCMLRFVLIYIVQSKYCTLGISYFCNAHNLQGHQINLRWIHFVRLEKMSILKLNDLFNACGPKHQHVYPNNGYNLIQTTYIDKDSDIKHARVCAAFDD